MTPEEARRILLAYRPGTSDQDDPEIVEALALAKCDPELACWLEESLETQTAFRQTLLGIAPPGELKEQILRAQKTFVSPKPIYPTKAFLIPAAALAVVVVVSAVLLNSKSESRTFADFRNRIVRTVIREYRMDIETENANEIQNFLRAEQFDLELPVTPALEQVPLIGAGRLSWKGNPVAMVCFETEAKQKLFLFAIHRTAVEAPPGDSGISGRISGLETLSWSAEGKVFVLSGEVDAGALKNFL